MIERPEHGPSPRCRGCAGVPPRAASGADPRAQTVARRRVGRWAPGHAIGWSLAALALPKCPACIAGYLSVLGLGLGVSTTVAGLLRPTFIALALAATALVLRRCLRPPHRFRRARRVAPARSS